MQLTSCLISPSNRMPIMAASLLFFLLSPIAKAAEKDELASALRLLEQVQASLARARAAETQENPTESRRYFFDYQQAATDLKTMSSGINHYLAPSRAQPRESGVVSGNYRRERP